MTRTAYWLLAASALTATCAAACSQTSDAGESEAAATSGPDGAEFVTVPVPGDHCRSIVLRGTQRFKGRAYVMPQPYIAANAQGLKLLQTMPKGDGFVIRIGVYFPAGAGDAAGQAQNLFSQLPDCKYDEIQRSVNANLPAAEKIGYPEPLSVNFIKVGLQGHPTPYLFGHEGTGILSYSGHDYIAEFEVADQAGLADFLGRLRSSLGTQLTFDFSFGARATDGFLEVEIDHSEVATRLDAALSAGGNLYGVMAAGQFEMALASAVSQASVNVYLEPSQTDQAFNDLAKQLIGVLVTNNPDIRVALPSLPEAGLPGEATDDAGSTGGLLERAIPKIDARAAVQHLRQQAKAKYKIQQATGIEQRVFTTNALLRSSWSAPGQEYLRAYSDGTDSTYMFSRNVVKGDTLTITPYSRSTDNIAYTNNLNYFYSKDDLTNGDHDMPARFPYLLTYQGSVIQSSDFPAYVWDGYTLSFWNQKYRTWGYTKATPNYGRGTSAKFELSDPGVRVQFAGSTRFTLAELGQSNDAWEGRVDPVLGNVIIVAKRDLQQLRVRNADKFDNTQVYPIRHFQRFWNGSNTMLAETFSDRDQPQDVPIKRSVVQIVVSSQAGAQNQIDPATVSVSSGADSPLRSPDAPAVVVPAAPH